MYGTEVPIRELFATSSLVLLGFSRESSTTFGPAEKLPGRLATGNPGFSAGGQHVYPTGNRLQIEQVYFVTRCFVVVFWVLGKTAIAPSGSGTQVEQVGQMQIMETVQASRCEQRRDTLQSKHGKARE